jgi:hypothetical protein
MMGTSYAFILTKSSDLPLYYFSFFLHMYNYVVIDSLAENGYCEVSGYCGELNPSDT